MDQLSHGVLRFDRFALDLTRGFLRAGDRDIDLRPKAFEVLCHLAKNAGRLVPKQELYEAVWPNAIVTDDSLVQCIGELREKLGDSGHSLIKTVHRRGYLLDAAVTTAVSPQLLEIAVGEAPAITTNETKASDSPGGGLPIPSQARIHEVKDSRWRTRLAAAAVLLFAALASAYLLARWTAPIPDSGQQSVSSSTTAAPGQSPRRVFKDCDACPEMVALPAGEFMMGSPNDEYGRTQAEGLPRRVVIAKPVAIGRFEVTVDQFSAFVAETGTAAGNLCSLIVKFDVFPVFGPPEASFRRPGYEVTGLHPVGCVSWHDAQAYVAWLRRRTGKPYRLPSEAEWEYAARAGTTARFSFGGD
jgi:DNA-binding winged helix-turn-helix (wHTH) protein